jgi:hypothetical protein
MLNQRAFISRQPTSNPQVSVPAIGHKAFTEPSPTGSSLYSITSKPYSVPKIVTDTLLTNLDPDSYTSGTTWSALVGNTYTVTGTLTKASTPGGSSAIVYDGSSAYAQDLTGIPASTVYSYTVDVWFNAAASVAGTLIGELASDAWDTPLLELGEQTNTMGMAFWTGAAGFHVIIGGYTANTWTHSACTYDTSTRDFVGYINGVRIATTRATKSYPTTINLTVGYSLNQQFTGQMGVFKYYSSALTDAQVYENYLALRPRYF